MPKKFVRGAFTGGSYISAPFGLNCFSKKIQLAFGWTPISQVNLTAGWKCRVVLAIFTFLERVALDRLLFW